MTRTELNAVEISDPMCVRVKKGRKLASVTFLYLHSKIISQEINTAQEHVHYNIITKVSMFALKVYTSNKTVCFIKLHSYTLAITGKGYNVDTNFSKKSSYKCQAAFHFKDFVVQV